jgi:branched-chain amino acid transport system substrate-binding protein
VEKAKSTETDKVREALRGLTWQTPQGEKTLRAEDHQAVQKMYVVQVTGGQFKIVGQVPGPEAIGKDECTRF